MTNPVGLLRRATNPTQYDLPDVTWTEEGAGIESPTRKFMWHYISHATDFKGKDVLDVGSGTGWLLNLALQNGANSVIGIEPSLKNAGLARQLFPRITTLNIPFEAYETQNQYDTILGVMSYIHMENLDEAFAKTRRLLKPSGQVCLIISDFDHYKKPRYGYKITTKDLSDGTYVASITRPAGVLASIVRSVDVFQKSASKAGLQLITDTPMLPTPELIRSVPRYTEHKNEASTRLLLFEIVQ